jgi:hypothetical protein
MIVRERQPVIYTSTANDWSAVSIVLAGLVLALLGFMVYYFSIMNAAEMANVAPQQTVIQHDITPVPVPTPVPVAQPAPTIIQQVPAPAQAPQPNTPSPGADASADTNSSGDANNQ